MTQGPQESKRSKKGANSGEAPRSRRLPHLLREAPMLRGAAGLKPAEAVSDSRPWRGLSPAKNKKSRIRTAQLWALKWSVGGSFVQVFDMRTMNISQTNPTRGFGKDRKHG